MMSRGPRWAVFVLAAMSAACGNKSESPTGPSDIPAPNSTINYTAIGASDAIGVGASNFCAPYVDCPNGRGYVHVTTRGLQGRGFTVNLVNLGFPATVISRRLQDLGVRYGRTIPGNFTDQQLPFVTATQTLVTIFAGGNDVETIIAALGGGAGGTDQPGYIQSQIQQFGQEFSTFVRTVREGAPSARVIVLNLPNMAGMPKYVPLPLQQRRAAQALSVGMTTSVINPVASSGVLVIDLMCDPRSYQASTYSSDGFHPGDAGYAWIAGEVMSAATTTYKQPQASCAQNTIVN